MFVFNNNKYDYLKETDYTNVIRNINDTLIMDIGINHPRIRKRKPKTYYPVKTHGVKRELLEYHYGIYRMFPCGKQHQYHMRFIHVPGVCERRIKG